MRITGIYIKNLFSYDEFELELDKNFNVIVGPNNAGKTNLFRVIQFLMDIIDNKLKAKDIREYLHDPTNEQAEIKIWVEFDDGEKKAIREFFECYFDRYLSELDRGIAQSTFKLNDVLPEYNGPERHYDKLILNQRVNELFVKSIKHFINTLPEFLSSGVFVWQYSGEYDALPEISFFTSYTINPDSVNVFLSRVNITKEASKHHKILKDYLLQGPVEVLFAVHPDDLRVSCDKSLHIESRGVPSIEKAIETQYTDFVRNTGVPYILKCLFDTSCVVPFEIFLLFLAKSEGLIMPTFQKEDIREPKKALAAKVFKQADLDFSRQMLRFHWLILRLFYNAIIKFSEVRSYPQPNSVEFVEKYNGNGSELASYLFYLKNSPDLGVRQKYQSIKEQFEQVFQSDSKISFDVVKTPDSAPEIIIVENMRQYSILRAASGIFEILNLLTVIHGNREKVILLDEPALHLHPVYQRNLAQRLKAVSTGNQVLMITHSPYLVGDALRPDAPGKVYRFYRTDRHTRGVDVKQHLDMKETKILRGDQHTRTLFASGVILTEGVSEYLSLLEIIPKLGYPLEDYNLELVLCNGKTEILQFVSLFGNLKIPYRIVCDEDTVITTLKEFYTAHPGVVFYSKGYRDWTDYLGALFPIKVSGGKAERAWKIAKTISPEEAQEKLDDLQEFIRRFIASL
ncbi:hypothetical protein APY94_09640 [Thermococcus celericrescens]|uniref:AAA domain-containing protein n=1 Tax=Thermococcus celericrescens TaxID=227598 RepID=A0A100XWM2_9EURY|nr:AAA family ATPase [Thermococcus celericrescens]KUH32545.1 hypothetical protein APY94_09640 [Thermococcus celericrescens]